jgi:two-component system CheB/CheR fusion protein
MASKKSTISSDGVAIPVKSRSRSNKSLLPKTTENNTVASLIVGEDLPEHSDELIVVGIGASAGGLEALRGLLSNLPTESNMAFVIAQHLDPKHPSMLTELLSRITHMAVSEIVQGELPQKNHIYITPPGHNIKFDGVHLVLEDAAKLGPKPSVDVFFSSLAESMGEQAVGIILSGTGSDGSQGMRAIKVAGGIAICQDDASAKYNGMPRAAVETGLIDLVCPPEEIGEALAGLLRNPPVRIELAHGARIKSGMGRIFQLLQQESGSDFSNYKQTTLARRIHRRMTVNKLDDLDDYILLLERSHEEREALFKDILISVTSFFRDAEAFEQLREVIRDIVLKANRSEGVRVWVPAAATGEEAYSIAILIEEVMHQENILLPFQIFATDLDTNALAKGRRATYSANLLRDVPSVIVKEYFIRKDDTFQVVKRIRERVVFARQDVIKDPPFSRIDLISCRNLLIYLVQAAQERLFSMFHYVLKKNGYLFLGKSETIAGLSELFDSTDKKSRIYRSIGVNTVFPSEFVRGASTSGVNNGVAKPVLNDKNAAVTSIESSFERAVMSHYVPSGLVVDERGNLIHAHGDVSRFLRIPVGKVSLDVLNLIRPEWRIDLRAMLHKARREGHVTGPRIALKETRENLTLHIIALETDSGGDTRLYGVLFELTTAMMAGTEAAGDAARVAADPRVNELEQELIALREHLQTTVEELETSNEELQSTNEELQSANEELQSTNEELETANEELQSTNEELMTVNEELRIKSGELASANSDLENILACLGLPMLVLDNRLRVTRYTLAAGSIFDLHASDIGQVITTLGTKIVLPDMRSYLYSVIEDEKEFHQDVSTDSMRYHMRVMPYFSEHRKVVGVVVFFEPQHLAKQLLPLDAIFGRLLPVALEKAQDGIVVLDCEGVTLLFNERASEIFGYSAREVVGQNISCLMPAPYSQNHDEYIMRPRREKRSVDMQRNVTAQRKDGSKVTISLVVHSVGVGADVVYVGLVSLANE